MATAKSKSKEEPAADELVPLAIGPLTAAFVAVLEEKLVPAGARHLIEGWLWKKINKGRAAGRTMVRRAALRETWWREYCDANSDVDPRLDRFPGWR